MENNKILIPLQINVIITEKHGLPAVELRMMTTNMELIKEIITSTFHSREIILRPVFTDVIKSTNSLIQKGIIYRGTDGKLYFND
jgi:hypothetical protein